MTHIINVVIVEPVAARRACLRYAVAQEPEFRIVGSGDDFLEACSLPVHRKKVVDVLLLNIDELGMCELDAWAAIHVLLPSVRIAALTSVRDDRALKTALGAGVTALHPLDVEPDILCRAVRHAAKGVVDFDPDLIERAKRRLLQPLEAVVADLGW